MKKTENQQERISKKLSDFFKKRGISQQTIAKEFGVSQPAISALLNGKKPFGKKLAKKWGEKFGLRPEFLLTGIGELEIVSEEGTQSLEDMIAILSKRVELQQNSIDLLTNQIVQEKKHSKTLFNFIETILQMIDRGERVNTKEVRRELLATAA